jgi:hypothetical protein
MAPVVREETVSDLPVQTDTAWSSRPNDGIPKTSLHLLDVPDHARETAILASTGVTVSKEFGRVETSDEPRSPPGSSSRPGRAFLEFMMGSRAG